MSNLKSILSSFKLKDDLNSKIWEKNNNGEYTMNPKVRTHLLEIANDFIDSLDVDVVFSDIIMTGSLANYNWSNYSDVDLHIIADFNQFPSNVKPLYDELFHLKKTVYGIKHNIKIYGYDVELYIEDESQSRDVESAGRYSIMYNEWVVTPPKEDVNINKDRVSEKAKQWMKIIDDVESDVQDEDIETAKKLIKKFTTKIRKFRECGLEKGGEYSEENLVFKILRRNGYLEKLKSMKDKLIDKKLSIQESNIEDPNLPDEKKADIVKPEVGEFYKNLDDINSNIYQESPKNYTFQKDVETVQIALDILGYKLPIFGVDGKFGPETAKAINDFKKDNNIEDLSESFNRVMEAYEDLPIINDTYNNITFDKRTTNDRLPKNLLDDLQDAAENAGITISVNWAKTGHGKYAKSGNVSRHWKGYAVDVSTVNGKSWSSKQMAKDKEIYDDIENFVALLKNKGYNINSETNNEKAVLYFGFPNHENHLHISNMSNIPSSDNEDEGTILDRIKNTFSKLFDSSDDSDKAFISPEMTTKLSEKLKEKNITSEDLEKYTKFKTDFSDAVTKNDEDFYKNILKSIGAPESQSNLKFLYSWRQAEGGTAKFNPFNTTYNLTNDKDMCLYNCIKDGKGTKPVDCKTCPDGAKPGVKSYSTSNFGLEATVLTLKNSKYFCIVDGLRKEKPPKEIANCDCLETWGTRDGISNVLVSNKINPKGIQGLS